MALSGLLPVRYVADDDPGSRRAESRYRVEREDTGKPLGRITRVGVPPRHAWIVAASKMAFLGTGPDDGEPLGDYVPPYLYMPEANGCLFGVYESRHAAMVALQRWLVRHKAPVMGFGAHPDVIRKERVAP